VGIVPRVATGIAPSVATTTGGRRGRAIVLSVVMVRVRGVPRVMAIVRSVGTMMRGRRAIVIVPTVVMVRARVVRRVMATVRFDATTMRGRRAMVIVRSVVMGSVRSDATGMGGRARATVGRNATAIVLSTVTPAAPVDRPVMVTVRSAVTVTPLGARGVTVSRAASAGVTVAPPATVGPVPAHLDVSTVRTPARRDRLRIAGNAVPRFRKRSPRGTCRALRATN